MFIVLLKFSSNKAAAKQFAQEHVQWLDQGMKDGFILAAGSLRPDIGGAILAHNISETALSQKLQQDPFVSEDVVRVEVMEFAASKTDERLSFLMPSS